MKGAIWSIVVDMPLNIKTGGRSLRRVLATAALPHLDEPLEMSPIWGRFPAPETAANTVLSN